jgi:hypothetical protein
MRFTLMTTVAWIVAIAAAPAAEIPANTWVRVADCPGDAEGREVPPGRGSTWAYCPPLKAFLRYGGYTPRFSNALDKFDPASGKWTRLAAEDENYPEDRPGGGCCWAMQYDERRKLVWLAAGLGTGWTGSRGIWSYDPAAGKFACYSKDLPRGVSRLCFDPANGLFVARPWPTCDGLGDGVTMIFTVEDRKWQSVRTNPLPQGQWGSPVAAMTYDSGLGRVVGVGGGKEFWTFDGAARKWERIETANGPSARACTVAAYDSDLKVVLLHGVHPGGYTHFDTGALNDTWILDTSKKEWKEIKTPSPAIPPALRNVARQALAYDSDLKRFTLADPDLGVWALRYDPAAEPGKECVAGGFVPAVGKVAGNPPADGAAEKLKEVRRTLPSPLNQRILDMADNSIMPLGGGGMPGDEVGWCYEAEAGVFVKYGGCGNWSNPLWGGYGNDLIYYDPGVERWYTRRSCDVSGAMRPGTGCTRSVFFDPARKVLWFFGGAASGPYCSTPSEPAGSFAYDLKADRFLVVPGDTKAGMGGNGCLLHGDPDHLVAICPSKDKVHSFDMKTASWSAKNTPGFAGLISGYCRMTYLKSKKVFLVFESAGANDKMVNRTMAYDPAAGAWADLAPKEMPTSRGCKFGLVYDSKNDVVLLMGGGTGWNTGWRNDMWVYAVKENRWEKVTPALAGGAKSLPAFTDNMPSGYDERHNAVIFTEGNQPWAYRYKK